MDDNRMVWDGASPGHYEVWYATFNHRPTGLGFWIRYTLESPTVGEARALLWFAVFDPRDPGRSWAIHRAWPITALTAGDAPFRLAIGDAVLENGAARGALAGDGHEAAWELDWAPCRTTHRHLPGLVYRTGFADTKVLSPNPAIRLRGAVTVDGERLVFDGDPGCQSHLWGRKHAEAWAWAHCSAFREDDSAWLEALSVRVRRGPLVLPALTFLAVNLGAEVYRFPLLARARWTTGVYGFRGISPRATVEGELRCRPVDLVRAPYRDPDGEACHCHNTEVADCILTLRLRRTFGGFGSPRVLTCHGAAHLEHAARSPDPHVARVHVAVR